LFSRQHKAYPNPFVSATPVSFLPLFYLSYQPGAILDCIDDVDTLDKVAQHIFS
jgi:hypothetical protein